MKKNILLAAVIYSLGSSCGFANTLSYLGANPTLQITPNSETHVQIGFEDRVSVFYIVRNPDTLPHRIFFNNNYPAGAVSRLANVPSGCNFTIELAAGASCQLGLSISGNRIPRGGIASGPQICVGTGPNVCSQPDIANILTINRP